MKLHICTAFNKEEFRLTLIKTQHLIVMGSHKLKVQMFSDNL